MSWTHYYSSDSYLVAISVDRTGWMRDDIGVDTGREKRERKIWSDCEDSIIAHEEQRKAGRYLRLGLDLAS